MPVADKDTPPTTVRKVFVEKPSQRIENATRQEIVQAGADLWNKKLGYEAIRFVNEARDADLIVKANVKVDPKDQNIYGGQARGGISPSRVSDLGPIKSGKVDIRGQLGVPDEIFTHDVIAHELGHELGLPDTYKETATSYQPGPGLMGGLGNELTTREQIEAWGKLARETYGVPVNDETIRELLVAQGSVQRAEDEPDWKEPPAGKMLESLQTTLRKWSAALYPQYAEQIHAGVPPRVLLQPYLNIAQQELEREVGLQDDFIQDAIVGGKAADVTTFRAHVRSLPEWDETSNAERLSAQFIKNINEGNV